MLTLPPCSASRSRVNSVMERRRHDEIDAGALHGGKVSLCKAIARRLAEAGCTPHQIGAITGHTTLKEVERYSASAARDGLADAGMAAMEGKK